MNNKVIPRGHHYVWQYYLKSWEIDGKIWWNRKGTIQKTGTQKILKEREMYKIHKLNKLEKLILDKIWMDDKRPELKNVLQHNLKMLDSISVFEDETPSRIIQKLVEEYGMVISQDGKEIDYRVFTEKFRDGEKSKEEIIEEVKKFRIEEGERQLTEDENLGREYLDKLRNDDISFFDYEKNIFDFYVFLNSQYLRTKKIRDRLIKNVDNMVPELKKLLKTNLNADGKKIYSHGLQGLILKMSVGMSKDSSYRIMMLKSKGKSFITSDQPVMNMDETLLEDGTPQEMKYLMPISPYSVIIISKEIQQNMVIDTDDKTVEYLNEVIKNNSYEMTLGIEQPIVEKYPPSSKN